MFRDNVELRTEERILFILSHCALGDGIGSLPAIEYARATHALDLPITVIAPGYALELFEHLIGGPGMDFRPIEELKPKATDRKMAGTGVFNYVPRNTSTRNRFDLVDFAYLTLLDMQVFDDRLRNYPHTAPLGPRTIPGPYIVIPVGSTNAPSRLRSGLLLSLAEWALDRGMRPVLVGKSQSSVQAIGMKGKEAKIIVTDEVDYLPGSVRLECLDLRDKTTLMEARDLCGHANAVVGIDGGMLHLAGTTDVPIVYGCTRVDPKHRGIVRYDERNWNLVHVRPRDLECSGCQSNWTLMFKHDFSTCAYGDSLCTEKLHADDFINGLRTLGL